MPMTLRHERDNVYRLDVHGWLRQEELERCEDALVGEIRRIGPVRLLVVLNGFEGWQEAGNDWRDLTFYVKYGDSIERIAIVGDEKWRSETLMFTGADLRRAPVEFFTQDNADGARAWLSA
jgi:SpoIIAA-like